MISPAANLLSLLRRLTGDDSHGGRTIQTFQTCIAAFENSVWPGVAWKFSGLATDGSPIEFGFSTHNNNLRYTVEVAGPEWDHLQRLLAACSLIERLGHSPPAPALVGEWQRLQAGAELQWGAWLGVRCGEKETLKLYIEMPPASSNPAISSLPGGLPGARLLMLGYELASGRTEYYYRKAPMNHFDLGRLGKYSRSLREFDALTTTFARLCQMPLAHALRWCPPAYSIAQKPGSDAMQLGLFLRARTMGSAGTARQAFLQRVNQPQSKKSLYEQCFESIPDQELPEQGVISIGCNRQGSEELGIGISGAALAALPVSTWTTSDRPVAADAQSNPPSH